MEKDIEFTKNKQTKKEKKQTDCINVQQKIPIGQLKNWITPSCPGQAKYPQQDVYNVGRVTLGLNKYSTTLTPAYLPCTITRKTLLVIESFYKNLQKTVKYDFLFVVTLHFVTLSCKIERTFGSLQIVVIFLLH